MNNELNNNFELPTVGSTPEESTPGMDVTPIAPSPESAGNKLPSTSSSLATVNDNALGSNPVAGSVFVDPSGTTNTTVPINQMQADDADLIEKEWVLKAKNIIAATKEDPRAQNVEINKVKAEYLKKRYGKEIKTEDS